MFLRVCFVLLLTVTVLKSVPLENTKILKVGLPGHEIVDHILTYEADGVTVKNDTVYYYGPDAVRASYANDGMAVKHTDILVDGNVWNQTFYDIRLGRGQEIVDTQVSYTSDGKTAR